MAGKSTAFLPIQSTAGAIPVKNDKGEVSMQKVKVIRYVTGKRPDYATRSSSDDDSDNDEFIAPIRIKKEEEEVEDVIKFDLSEAEKYDPRLRRLQLSSRNRNRRVEDPEVIGDSDSDNEHLHARHIDSDESDSDEEEDDKVIEKRRALIRQRALEKWEEDEILTKEEEKVSGESEEESESEYEDTTESEEETVPRLKPLFVKKSQRATIKSEPEHKEEEVFKKQEQKRFETLKIVESEMGHDKSVKDVESQATMPQISDVITDDENEEADYEAWKLRELRRVKRDKDERETLERERLEVEKMHNLTEEERRTELKLKSRIVDNKAVKGKYKFLQKYYHRGAFYLDKEEDVLKRDNSMPTLEDHFDKTILPKVMQVKNFGRSGRTKYTHLVDQDTTNFESPWAVDSAANLKFYSSRAAGSRQVFNKPSTRKRPMDEPNF